METTQSLTRLIAKELQDSRPDTADAVWDIRGEIADDVVYSADLIAILMFTSNTEEVYGNRTQRMTGQLVGQFLIGEHTPEECEAELNILLETAYSYIGSLRYTEVGDAVVIQGTCDNFSYAKAANGIHYSWELPIELIVQF